MRKELLALCCCMVFLATGANLQAQTFRVGVFDMDLMIQAMPGYRAVDSMVQIYETDSLSGEYQYYELEFARLDSTYKADSALAAAGVKSKAIWDRVAEDRRKMGLNIVYWQQIAQNKSNAKRSRLAEPLYQMASSAYMKVLAKRKYNLILKPNTYEAGFAIDNLFISMARELKLSGLPQELIYLGRDPDAVQQPAKPAGTTKPKTN